jgi:hypothetical protein
MTTGQILLALGGGFAATLMAFQQMARQRGWPYGSVFQANVVPTIVSLACFLAIIGRVVVAFVSHSNGWSTAGFALLGTFLGVAVFTTVLGKSSGPLALVLAPVLCIASFFFA